LGEKARAFRAEGLSWTQVSERLGVGRTTARRLCQDPSRGRGEAIESPRVAENVLAEPAFQNGAESVPNATAQSGPAGHGASENHASREEVKALPQTFRILASLLRRAAEEGQNGEGA